MREERRETVSDMTENNVPHVIIVGAGFGGLNAALALRKCSCARNSHRS